MLVSSGKKFKCGAPHPFVNPESNEELAATAYRWELPDCPPSCAWGPNTLPEGLVSGIASVRILAELVPFCARRDVSKAALEPQTAACA